MCRDNWFYACIDGIKYPSDWPKYDIDTKKSQPAQDNIQINGIFEQEDKY